jgi:hypothetical protein
VKRSLLIAILLVACGGAQTSVESSGVDRDPEAEGAHSLAQEILGGSAVALDAAEHTITALQCSTPHNQPRVCALCAEIADPDTEDAACHVVGATDDEIETLAPSLQGRMRLTAIEWPAGQEELALPGGRQLRWSSSGLASGSHEYPIDELEGFEVRPSAVFTSSDTSFVAVRLDFRPLPQNGTAARSEGYLVANIAP